jgi:hypothetical protein
MKGKWSKLEDELLKFSVLKFGLNKWEKISSGINKKNSSECKKRWYEWIDYKIKKKKWKNEEDRRLSSMNDILKANLGLISYFLRRNVLQCRFRSEILIWIKNISKNRKPIKEKFHSRRILNNKKIFFINRKKKFFEKKTRNVVELKIRYVNNKGKKKISRILTKKKDKFFGKKKIPYFNKKVFKKEAFWNKKLGLKRRQFLIWCKIFFGKKIGL